MSNEAQMRPKTEAELTPEERFKRLQAATAHEASPQFETDQTTTDDGNE